MRKQLLGLPGPAPERGPRRVSLTVRRARLAEAALAAVLTLGGCAPSTPPIPPDIASVIVIGRTTLGDLRELLGEPRTLDSSPTGRTATWRQDESSTLGTGHTRRLVVELAPTGEVRSFDYQSNVPGEAP